MIVTDHLNFVTLSLSWTPLITPSILLCPVPPAAQGEELLRSSPWFCLEQVCCYWCHKRDISKPASEKDSVFSFFLPSVPFLSFYFFLSYWINCIYIVFFLLLKVQSCLWYTMVAWFVKRNADREDHRLFVLYNHFALSLKFIPLHFCNHIINQTFYRVCCVAVIVINSVCVFLFSLM